MELVLNSAPLILLFLSLAGIAVALLTLRGLYRRNGSVMKAAMLSLEQSRDNSKKLDQISVQIEGSRAHQQRMFDHHRIILGSLNTQLTKIDLLLNSQNTDKVAIPSERASGKLRSAYLPTSGKSHSYVKIASDNLPKTQNGMQLLKDVFQRREPSNLSKLESNQGNELPTMLNNTVEPSEDEIFGEAIEKALADDFEEDPVNEEVLPDHSSGRKNLLGLFTDQQLSANGIDELFKRSA